MPCILLVLPSVLFGAVAIVLFAKNHELKELNSDLMKRMAVCGHADSVM